MAQKNKNWYQEIPYYLGMFISFKLFGLLETFIGIATFFYLTTKEKKETLPAFAAAAVVTVVSTIIFGMIIHSK